MTCCYIDLAADCNTRFARVVAFVHDAMEEDVEAFRVRVGSMRPAPCFESGDPDAVLGDLRSGDVLVVPSVDHLGRSVWRVLDVVRDLGVRGVRFVSLAEGIDTDVPHLNAAVSMMRAMLDAERRLMSRRQNGTLRAVVAPVPSQDDPLSVLRREAEPWLALVRRHRPDASWREIVEMVRASGIDCPGLSPRAMLRTVRGLVDAGDLSADVLRPARRPASSGSAMERARVLLEADPGLSLRRIGAILTEEGHHPPRAGSWSAQTVKRLLDGAEAA